MSSRTPTPAVRVARALAWMVIGFLVALMALPWVVMATKWAVRS